MKIHIVFFLLLFSFSFFGQLQTYSYPSPIIGVGQSDFLGTNYNVISSTFTGAYYAIGHFDATNTTLGVDKGILLSTGVVVDNGFGPHGPNDLEGCSTNLGYPGDLAVSSIYFSGSSVQNYPFDMAKLEIEFIPLVDSIKIKYVFASEEYPASQTLFNDFFAVQLYKNDTTLVSNNIASLPFNNVVAINNVNNGLNNTGPCDNCLLYQENGMGTNQPYFSNNQYVQFDGFTKNTSIYANSLEIGTVYRMVIYLSDINDAHGDSGVFLESCASCDFKVGIDEQNELDFSVFPNPARESITIEANVGTEFELMDANGKTLFSGDMEQSSQVISVDEVSPGVYFLKTTNGNSRRIEKVVIQ